MGPAGGLMELLRNAKAGTQCSYEGTTWQMASTVEAKPRSLYLMVGIVTSSINLLLTSLCALSVILLSLLYAYSQTLFSSLLGD